MRSHTEKQNRGSDKNTKVSEHTVCDEYKTILSKYQSILKLKRKREGQKTRRTFELNFKQTEEGSDLEFEFIETSTDAPLAVTVQTHTNKTIFNYKGALHIDRFLKNKTGLWDPQELLEAPYAQEKEINLTEDHPKITLKEEKYGPIVKELTVSLSGSRKPFVLKVEHYGVEKISLQAIAYTHNGAKQLKYINGYLPIKKIHTIEIEKNDKATGDDIIKIFIAQKYMKKDTLKVIVKKVEPSLITSLSTKTVDDHTKVSIQSKSLVKF